MVLIAAGQTNKEIANTVGLDVKTLRRHYGHLIKQRDVMLSRLRSRLRTEQIKLGLAGNAAALSNALKMLDTVSAEHAARSLRGKAANQPAAKGYVSKKEQSLEAARAVGGKYAVRQPPRLVANNGAVLAADDGGED